MGGVGGGVGGRCVWSGRVGRGVVVSEFFFDTESIFLGGEYFSIN